MSSRNMKQKENDIHYIVNDVIELSVVWNKLEASALDI